MVEEDYEPHEVLVDDLAFISGEDMPEPKFIKEIWTPIFREIDMVPRMRLRRELQWMMGDLTRPLREDLYDWEYLQRMWE